MLYNVVSSQTNMTSVPQLIKGSEKSSRKGNSFVLTQHFANVLTMEPSFPWQCLFRSIQLCMKQKHTPKSVCCVALFPSVQGIFMQDKKVKQTHSVSKHFLSIWTRHQDYKGQQIIVSDINQGSRFHGGKRYLKLQVLQMLWQRVF